MVQAMGEREPWQAAKHFGCGALGIDDAARETVDCNVPLAVVHIKEGLGRHRGSQMLCWSIDNEDAVDTTDRSWTMSRCRGQERRDGSRYIWVLCFGQEE